jgi:hypothetical protein
MVGSILTWLSEVVNQGGGDGYIPTDIAGDTDSRYGAICGQKRECGNKHFSSNLIK